jgi:hypothetical protein
MRWQGNEITNSHGPGRGCNYRVVYCFLSVLSAHINFPNSSKTPPTQLHYHSHWVNILIRLTYASIFFSVAFLFGMLGHWRWRQQATEKCYLPTDTALCPRRLRPLKAKVTEMYNHFRTVGWCLLYNLVAFLLIYTACHLLWRSSVSIRKPTDFLGVRERPLSKTHPLTEQKCDLATMLKIGYKPAIPKSV